MDTVDVLLSGCSEKLDAQDALLAWSTSILAARIRIGVNAISHFIFMHHLEIIEVQSHQSTLVL